jgi:excisionase family DNA binding protein
MIAESSPPQLWDTQKTAEYLGFTLATVDAMLRRGYLPGVKVGNRWFVPVARLAAIFDERVAV